jgi:hypothetical protein
MKHEEKVDAATVAAMNNFRTLISKGPDFGTITLSIHFSDGIPYRIESVRNESILIKEQAQ